MKQTDIKVGKKYTDTKGGVREVIAEGPQCKLYGTVENSDCLRYRLIAKKRGPGFVGNEYNMTRIAFASWAKEEVK